MLKCKCGKWKKNQMQQYHFERCIDAVIFELARWYDLLKVSLFTTRHDFEVCSCITSPHRINLSGQMMFNINGWQISLCSTGIVTVICHCWLDALLCMQVHVLLHFTVIFHYASSDINSLQDTMEFLSCLWAIVAMAGAFRDLNGLCPLQLFFERILKV